MLALMQRVTHARVVVEGNTIAKIEQGLLILCGFRPQDTNKTLVKMLKKCLQYRVFSDDDGKMNLSVKDIDGSMLLVPQFTLAASTTKGLRPSFSSAATPSHGEQLFSQLITLAKAHSTHVAFGQFGANMQVELSNDGPVTFMLEFH